MTKVDRAVKTIAKIGGFVLLLFFLYGLLRFPDFPIRSCGEEKYCGKQGQARNRSDYEAFQVYETLFPWVVALGFLLAASQLREQRIKAVERLRGNNVE